MAILLIACAALLQDDARALAEKLRSESVVEREDAYRALKGIGPRALPAIERAAKEGDPEEARLAERLIRVIPVLGRISPDLLRALPLLEERVVDRADGWSLELFEAAARPDRHPALRRRDLDFLAVEAARSGRELDSVCPIVLRLRLRAPLPELVKHLAHDAPSIRAGVARTLGDLDFREAAPAIAGLLQDGSPSVRLSAALALRALDARAAIPSIVPLLGDADRDVRWGAVRALAGFGAKEALPELLRLSGSDDYRSVFAIELMESSNLDGTRPALARLLRERKDGFGRERLSLALSIAGGREELAELLKGPDLELRRFAALGLGRMGARESIPELRRMGGRVAARLLYRMGEKDLLPVLLEPLGNPEPRERIEAIRQVAELGAKEAAPSIRPLLQDADPAVQAEASEALALLGEPAATPAPAPTERIADLVARLAAAEENARGTAFAALRTAGAKTTAPLVLELLESRSADDRQAAIEALAGLGARDAVPALVRRLDDPVTRVRVAAAKALCRLGSRDGVALLLEERANLAALNALREPAAWEAVDRSRLRRRRGLTSPRDLKDEFLEWSGDRGLRARWEPGSDGEVHLWKSELSLGSPGHRRLPASDATDELESLMEDGRYAAIVERGALWVVPYERAWAFWSAWWNARSK